ncbi:Transposon Tf2-9 polyprotein [Nosema granulosis]|uniref:RNA-directed DNA polymerase n=1 Tax=Nosema granulosis TaxID=83296 RepID=A0A9P6GVY6_9MICR|nr:Transposon Tf2-9 polyprotein [Nosema granulosis]
MSSHLSCRIEVNKEYLDLVIDTGSQENYVSNGVLSKLHATVEKTERTVELANGRTMLINQKVTLQFRIEGEPKIFEEDFYILPTLPCSGILGFSFLRKHNCHIDFSIPRLCFKEHREPFSNTITPDEEIKIKSDLIYSPSIEFSNFLYEFEKRNPTLGCIKTDAMTVPLTSTVPVHKKPYPIPVALLPKVKQEIRRLIKLGVIKESKSEYASPAFPISKKNGDLRLVIDYRELNKVTVKLGYPFPSIQYSLMELKGSRFFSQLDLNMGYYQIPIAEEDTHKTSFVLPFGQYEFLRMPFGLTNAPREFQRVMTTIFQDMPFVKVFVDDILIFSENQKEHERHVIDVLRRCLERGISINMQKSTFLLKEVKYLGKIINEDGIKADTSALVKIDPLKIPRTKKQIMRILGIINWFRDHIPKLSQKITPITNKLQKNAKCTWSDYGTQCIKEIVKDIKTNIVLHHPDLENPFTISTDASDEGIGAVLEQEGKVVGLYSHKLQTAEKNYTTTEKELLAIIKALKHFRPIIFGCEILVKTDHRNLLYITECQTNRAQRWKILLDEFGVKLEYIKGEENVGADLLSRCLLTKIAAVPTQINPIMEKIGRKRIEDFPMQMQGLSRSEMFPVTIQDVYFMTDRQQRIIIPEDCEKQIIQQAHEILVHPGINKLTKTLSSGFVIKNIVKKVKGYNVTCKVCQLNKSTQSKLGTLTGFLTANAPFENIAVDFFGPIETRHFENGESSNTKLHLLVIIDIFSKWVKIVPLRKITAKSTIKAIKKHWFDKFGAPKNLLSDQGKQFVSQEFTSFLQQNKVEHRKSSIYNPTGNSVVERANKVIGTSLRCLKNLSIKDAIRRTERAMRNSYHITLNATPYQVIHGVHPLNPLKKYEVDIQQIINRKKTIAEKDLTRRNSKRRSYQYRENQLVLMLKPLPDKLEDIWEGPYRIVRTNNRRNYVIIEKDKRFIRVNIKRIKPFKRGKHVMY